MLTHRVISNGQEPFSQLAPTLGALFSNLGRIPTLGQLLQTRAHWPSPHLRNVISPLVLVWRLPATGLLIANSRPPTNILQRTHLESRHHGVFPEQLSAM